MCINEETSVLTLIIGTIINLYVGLDLFKRNKVSALSMVILWQYALLMQIPDMLAWDDIKKNKSDKNTGKLAAFLNLTQPLLLFLVVFFITKNKSCLIFGFVALLLYIIDVLSNMHKFDFKIEPGKECSSLDYRWWSNLNPIFYTIVFPLILLCLPDLNYAILNISIYFITLILSIAINYGCNPGSWWCWSVASGGLINYIFSIVY